MASLPSKSSIVPFLLLSLLASNSADVDHAALLDRHQTQIARLETLVESLSTTVSRLESSIPRRRVGPAWSERFEFVAAARVEANVTAFAVLPYVDFEGMSKYFAVGDSSGGFFVFTSSSDLVIESEVKDGSAVTAMLAYHLPRRNESAVVIGHADGSVIAHWVAESGNYESYWYGLSVTRSQVLCNASEVGLGSPVELLEVHQIGRVRLVVVSDSAGVIRVFSENGTLHGSVLASEKPLALMKQRLIFLTGSGVGWLDLRRMIAKENKCEGLDGSVVRIYAFDALQRTKAYGFTSNGDLVHVALVGEAGSPKCRVHVKRKSDVGDPAAMLAIKGHLLVVDPDRVFLYNVSSPYYSRIGAARPVLFATLAEMRSMFANSNSVNGDSSGGVSKPLIAGDREKFVVLGLGDGYIGLYRSNLPVFEVQRNAMILSRPAMLFVMFILGMCYFFMKRRSSGGWSNGDPSRGGSVIVPGDPLGPSVADRLSADTSRATDPRDLRGSVLRDPTRRFMSSSHYPGGTSLYRTSSGDLGFGGADMNYRVQGLEPTGLHKRRESVFRQSADDNID